MSHVTETESTSCRGFNNAEARPYRSTTRMHAHVLTGGGYRVASCHALTHGEDHVMSCQRRAAKVCVGRHGVGWEDMRWSCRTRQAGFIGSWRTCRCPSSRERLCAHEVTPIVLQPADRSGMLDAFACERPTQRGAGGSRCRWAGTARRALHMGVTNPWIQCVILFALRQGGRADTYRSLLAASRRFTALWAPTFRRQHCHLRKSTPAIL